MKKSFLALLVIVLLFVGFILVKTLTFTSSQLKVDVIEKITIPEAAIGHLQQALRLKTISFENESEFDSTGFEAFNRLLQENYPLIDSLLEHKVFSQYSHLYKWQGSDATLKPIVLMGHIDVVPIASPDKWTVDPFAGEIKDGKIWGRGTIDDKFSVIGILEATEMLLTDGFEPKRTVYLSFGHDEEIGGDKGAVLIAEYLTRQGVEAEFVLDEGYAITQKLIPGIQPDAALIGIAEKGSTTIEFTVDMEGGHSSQPAKETAIDVLSNAMAKLKANPLEPTLSEPMQGFMDQLGPEMGFVNKMAFANRNLFKGMIISTYENASGAGNALVRTTTSPTIFEAGIKENVIPTYARSVVNFRIIPRQTADDVMTHVKTVIDDGRVKPKFYGFNTNPSKVSPIDSHGYKSINKTIKQVFDNALTAPNLVIAATDSRHFGSVSSNIYRFVPYHINEDNINTFHGVDEHIPVEDYKDAIRFYHQLIKSSLD
ncbi:M20 family peptidase [Roseivirga sp. E12]|uniref:M20 family peptidase n=1 Tax=Roseivirga sp. E12 TaxID=2819237 RepID=UPI001ABC8747|nr:M20 family peptidase [Roseivirga sp. E12]MBO3698575.1 M20 family peptidase [Roseivirga sp. E12]